MNCIKCNTPNIPEAKFCKNCGANLVTPEIQAKTDQQTIKSLLIVIGIDYLLSLLMFFIQKVIVPYATANNDYSHVDLIYQVYGWVSDIVTLAAMIVFLITIKNQMVKNALIVFIVLRFLFMLGYRVFPFLF